MVEREPYDRAYQQVNPQTGEQLGRKASGKEKYDQLLNAMKAAEPHATAERIGRCSASRTSKATGQRHIRTSR